MSTVSKFANAHSAIATGYTNPTNAFADDTAYATATPAKNADVSAYWGFPSFSTSDIPDGATINSVQVKHIFYVDTQASQGQEYIQVFLNTTGIETEQSDLTEPLSDTELSHTVTTGISLSDLRTADVVRARTRSRRIVSNTAVTFYIDYVQIIVDWTAGASPITGSSTGATTTTGSAKGKGRLIALANPATTATAHAKATGKISGSIALNASVSGFLQGKKRITASTQTAAAAAATLKGKGLLHGTTGATTLITGIITGNAATGETNFFFMFF